MIGRRGFLTALLGAPAIGRSVVESAMAVEDTGPVAGISSLTHRDPLPDWMSQKLRNYRDVIDGEFFDVPIHVEQMKSWSETFKRSVARKEHLKRRDLINELHSIDWYDQKQVMAFLVKKGLA